jgi:hypothetical protein
MLLLASCLCSAAAMSIASDTATKAALVQMGLAREVKVARAPPPATLHLQEEEVAWQEMGFVSEVRTRPPSARKELMASILRDDVAYKPTKKLAKPDNVVIKAAFPDLGGSTDSILRAKRRSAPSQRSKSASFARNKARGA